MNKKIKWAGAIIMLILIIVFSVFFRISNDKEISVLEVSKNDYMYSVAATGTLGPYESVVLKSEINGTVKNLLTEIGGLVKESDILISFDNEDATISNEIAVSDYNQALNAYNDLIKNKFEEAKKEEQLLLLEMESDRKSYNNGVELYKEGAISKKDLEDLQIIYEAKLKSYESAKINRIAMDEAGSMRNEYAIKLSQSQSKLDSSEIMLGMYNIQSPYEGYVYDVFINKGDYVSIGSPLLEIGKSGKYKVVSEIDERYFSDIKINQTVMIYIEDRLLDIKGKINKKYPKINDETGAFEIEIILDEPFSYLVSNLTVNIQINIKTFKDVIGIPSEFVREIDDKYFVSIKNGNEWNDKEVIIRNRINNIVIIEQGINEQAIIRIVE